MVSFVCDECQETIKKPKLDNHKLKCHRAVFSCIDCSKTFQGLEYRDHTYCMTEKEKYEKPKKLVFNPKSESIVKSLEKSQSHATSRSSYPSQTKETNQTKETRENEAKMADKDILTRILKKKSLSYQKLEKKCVKKGINLGKLLVNASLSLQDDKIIIQL